MQGFCGDRPEIVKGAMDGGKATDRIGGAGMDIGGMSVFPPLVMAPMAGLSTVAFRRLLGELGGVGLYYSEMLSARALQHETPKRSIYLRSEGEPRPLCLQIMASEPSQIGPAVERGSLWHPEAWDLNFGCPAPEIVKRGAGAFFIGRPERAREMTAAMRRAVSGPLLVKTRAGTDRKETLAFLRMLAGEGVDGLVLHMRTAAEKYGRPAKRERLEGIPERLGIPVIGNGDAREPSDVLDMMKSTGCSGVMIGRAAVQKPWIFRQSAGLFGAVLPPNPFRRKSEIFTRLAELLGEELEHPRDLYRLREFTVYFSRNYKFGHQLWKRVNAAQTTAEALKEGRDFFERNSGEDRLRE